MIYIIILGAVLILILVSYNSFIKKENEVKEAFATMDVYLKKRWDLIPSLVEIVKGYASHEKTTLEEVVRLRNSIYDDMTTNEKIDSNEKMSKNISRLMVLVESYPELKASDNFKNLANELTRVEDEIAQSRKYYNATVRIFNNKVEMFPSNIIAKIFRFKTKKMFEAKKEEKEVVKVDL